MFSITTIFTTKMAKKKGFWKYMMPVVFLTNGYLILRAFKTVDI